MVLLMYKIGPLIQPLGIFKMLLVAKIPKKKLTLTFLAPGLSNPLPMFDQSYGPVVLLI